MYTHIHIQLQFLIHGEQTHPQIHLESTADGLLFQQFISQHSNAKSHTVANDASHLVECVTFSRAGDPFLLHPAPLNLSYQFECFVLHQSLK